MARVGQRSAEEDDEEEDGAEEGEEEAGCGSVSSGRRRRRRRRRTAQHVEAAVLDSRVVQVDPDIQPALGLRRDRDEMR